MRIENAQGGAELTLDIGQHGERQIPQVIVILPPGEVYEFGISAAAKKLRVAILELFVSLPKAAISVGHTKVKSSARRSRSSTSLYSPDP